MDPVREQILRDWHDQWAKARKKGRFRYAISIAAIAASFSAGGALLNRLIGIFPHHYSRDLIFVLLSIPAGAAIGWIAWQKNERDFTARLAEKRVEESDAGTSA